MSFEERGGIILLAIERNVGRKMDNQELSVGNQKGFRYGAYVIILGSM